ncbi:rho guanine nucleotide exchange factor 5 isoform X2 [Brachyhypopomus gauderio]|uniref:rho guanine nucleotide exchange factor 5 isoform X2 n=1 Tax=Brachyhypopomus gauderio TaxID=698409 RepID=UPI0040413848
MGRDGNNTKPSLPPKPQLTGGRQPGAAGILNLEETRHRTNPSRRKPSHTVNKNSTPAVQPQCLESPVQTKPVPKPRLCRRLPLADTLSHPVGPDHVNISSPASLSGQTVSMGDSSGRGSGFLSCTCLGRLGSRCKLTHDAQCKNSSDAVHVHINIEDSRHRVDKGNSVHEITQHEKPRRVPPSIPLPPRPLPREPWRIFITNERIADCDASYTDPDVSAQGVYCSLTPREAQQLGGLTSVSSSVQEQRASKSVPALRARVKDTPTTQEQPEHPEAESVILENLRSELCRLLSGEDQDRNVDIKKPQTTKDLVKLILSKSITQTASEQRKGPGIGLCLFPSRSKAHTTADKSQISPTENPERAAVLHNKSVNVETQLLKEHTAKTVKYEHLPAAMLPSSGLEVHGKRNCTHWDSKLNNNNSQKPLESLWQERCVVRDKGILSQLPKDELLLQESLYEVVTSEQQYLDGLTVAVDHFQNSQELSLAITSIEHKLLFYGLHKIREISQNFMSSLVQTLDSSLFCDAICAVVHQYASGPFEAYVHYIRNMPYQKQALITLRKENPWVVDILSRLEEHPCCSRLPLESFLSLPFQRIPRLKILMETVLKRTRSGSDLQTSAERALGEISMVLEECNREVGKMKQMEQLVHIANKTDFQCKSLPLVSSSRWLLKEGDVLQLCQNDNIFGQKRISPVHVFLFNDLLLVTTKKGSDRYVVLDHAHRSLVEVREGAHLEEDLDGCDLNRVFQLALIKNHRGTTSHVLLQASTQAERDGWLDVLQTQRGTEEGVYEEWDCPQVRCIEAYHGKRPEELSLQREDIVNIFQKRPDGYMEGRRLHDGKSGWFPAACVVEISSEHVQRRHLRERYHVLQTAAHMLKRHIHRDCHTSSCFR